ncbi:MAG TPA: SDR family oxidoreductase [Polyangiaceae bacterium LLY-WYZ-15_(1-7)]|nr:SDR family oxidoreductase [Polyangiaceae bacterium LLY-WYZ-15_(1-7)]HJL04645.1 SDR family oxidoreductase [Polyangiaceae bacterium LLY-WYZ-15_(1-7)]HJL07427.1 SDR family oxidoreductase [Polyangiaceae bacterium LLY-WYZ-15_(1-7)]HJL22193.1 SDR family oxidoreductase [Polyangiaceae bacterium LLY-WYZ-15_(1-7)]HJL29431.1 SDR family oxidoreductase [Polyangiaceae bacterium LLY-WYZ-15_(1-7)]
MGTMPKVQVPDMRGKVCMVTGANTGIGEVTALELARAGAHVFLACRSRERTQPALDRIRRETGNEAVELLPLDLGDFASVRACAEAFLARDLPLHVLVANAGLAGQKGLTKEGFELAWGVNHLGHFLLVHLLLEKLKASAPARVVIVASKGHRKARTVHLDRKREPTRSFTGFTEYAESKAANIFFARELGRRLEGTGVTTYSLHPGVVASDVWRKVPWPIRPLMKMRMISNEEGAQTSLYCATAPELEGETGHYYDECARAEPYPPATDEALSAETWRRSMEWVGLTD